MMKILLLEDDKTLHESLKAYLELENFEVLSAFSAQEAYERTYDNKFDLYIFDVNLGGEDGFTVLEELRSSGDETPTIYITALSDIASMTKGFNAGADDYIKKPFDPEELVLRIKSRYVVDNLLHYKNISYDPVKREVCRESELIVLSNILSNLFHLFMTNQDRVVDTHLLLDTLRSPNANALRVNLNKLKVQLDLEIKNIKGVGYMLETV
jgi:DNA-binding response OmpR family regulator